MAHWLKIAGLNPTCSLKTHLKYSNVKPQSDLQRERECREAEVGVEGVKGDGRRLAMGGEYTIQYTDDAL